MPQRPIEQNSVIYIGNLDRSISEDMLSSFLANQGALVKLKVMRDARTKQPRGFAFATFATNKDAEQACANLNHTIFQGREIKVYIKRKTSDFQADANLFIKNLDLKITSKQLQEMTEPYGRVLSCYVKYKNHSNESLGYGYCQFEEVEAANKCKESLHGTELNGKAISVEKFVPRAKRGLKPRCNLYVRGFPEEWDEAKINEYIKVTFELYGEIKSMAVHYNKKLGKYSAFVCLDSEENASKAQTELFNSDFPGTDSANKVYINLAESKQSRQNSLSVNKTNVYIRGIREDVTDEQLRSILEEFGQITSLSLKLHTMKNSQKKVQFGYCNFSKQEEASMAISEGSKNEALRALIDFETIRNNQTFIQYFQTKVQREQYLQTQKRKGKGRGPNRMGNSAFFMIE